MSEMAGIPLISTNGYVLGKIKITIPIVGDNLEGARVLSSLL